MLFSPCSEFIGNTLRTTLRTTYTRFERSISSASLLGGFVFDAVTLKRVDAFWENVWYVAHLAVVAICILALNRAENSGAEAGEPSKAHFWFINTLQFFFGGLLSTLLVFYFRSGSLRVSWPFLLILGAAFLANERLKQYYARLYFQVGSFLPVAVLLHDFHSAGRAAPDRGIYLSAERGVSLALMYLFLLLLRSARR